MSNTSRKSVDLALKPLTTISGHEATILSIAYLPDGERLVSCSDDRTVRIWDAGNAEQEGTSMQYDGRVYALTVTRDGQRILSGGMDRGIKVWDVETHELIEEWESHEGDILAIALSPDNRLGANGDGKGKIVIREMKEGQEPSEVKRLIEAGSSDTSVYSLCFSPNGEKLACAVNKQGREVDLGIGDYAIQVYDVESGELILGPIIGHEDWIRCVLWSLDGTQLFSASDDHNIRCWDSDTGKPIEEPWTGHTDQVTSLSLSSDGTKLASSSSDRTVRFWDAHSGDPIGQPLRHDSHLLWAVALSPSGEFVASGGTDEKISIWRVPWWDDSEKEPHKSFLDLPAIPVFKGLPNDQQQSGLDFLDLPTSRRQFTSSHRPPADSAKARTVKRVQRFWHRHVAHRTSSSSPLQGIELDEMQDRRFWKSPPITEVAAGRLTDRVKVGRREPRRKKKDDKSRKPHKSQTHTNSSTAAAGPSSNGERSGSTSNAGPSNSQAGPSTVSNTAPAGRSSSFAQSNTGSDDSWDDMDCGGKCVDYFCFGPRENRERFRPWKKKSRAVIEAEEQAKKEKREKNARKHRNKKAPKARNAVRPPHHHDPRGEHIEAASPATHDTDDSKRESLGDGAVPRIVLQLQEQNEQLRRRLDDSVAANQKAEVERERLVEEMTKLRSAGYDHTSSSVAEAGPFSPNAEPASNVEPSPSPAQTQNIMLQPHHHDAQGDNQLDGTVPQFALQLQEQMYQLRQQVDDLVVAKRQADTERDLLAKEVKELRFSGPKSHV